MLVIFLLFLILFVYDLKIYVKQFNNEYMEKENTTITNGFFVILVFFSHFFTYITIENKQDKILLYIISKIGQLMVTTFLFFSGYGIYQSIKFKKDYMKNFFKKRFLVTLINFDIVVLIFLIIGIILKKQFSITQIILSLVGWESLGNSNWYMMTIFAMYLITMFSFKLFKDDKKSLITITGLSILYVVIISRFKESYWCDTAICFPAGLWYAYYKKKIDKFLLGDNKKYILVLLTNTILLAVLYFKKSGVYLYNIFSILFVLEIVFILAKVKLKSKVFHYFGKRVFWIYILQRIPMILLNTKPLNNYVYFIICFTCTIVFSEIMNKIMKKFYKIIKI